MDTTNFKQDGKLFEIFSLIIFLLCEQDPGFFGLEIINQEPDSKCPRFLVLIKYFPL
jgi:hypothetical protein